MDVNLTISLMRGQMGVVIEKAVNAAVETVLGEMIRVVSVKLEEFRREMTAKEKENENIRNMLEMSRCQLKALRKYVNALTAKNDRQTFPTVGNQHKLALSGSGLVRFHPGGAHQDGTAAAAAVVRSCAKTTPSCSGTLTLSPKTRNPETAHAADNTWESQFNTPKVHVTQESIPSEDYSSPQMYTEEMHGSRIHLESIKAESSNADVKASEGLVAESSDPLWGQTPPTLSEPEHAETLGSSFLPAADTGEVFSTASGECSRPSIQVKQEDAEVEIMKVKEEPGEAGNSSTSECLRIDLGQQITESGSGISVEPSLGQQCHQIPTATEPAFMGVDPNTFAESQLAMAGAQRQVPPWCRDVNLYEEYKRKRIEVRRRSETRRRELEQTLPQALLADLVKERREKTRLRVARWRAKRKLQACLMSQAAQLNGAPAQALLAQRCGRRQAAQGGFAIGRVHSETGAYTLPLQMGSSPALAAQRLGLAEGSGVFARQRNKAPHSQTYQ